MPENLCIYPVNTYQDNNCSKQIEDEKQNLVHTIQKHLFVLYILYNWWSQQHPEKAACKEMPYDILL